MSMQQFKAQFKALRYPSTPEQVSELLDIIDEVQLLVDRADSVYTGLEHILIEDMSSKVRESDVEQAMASLGGAVRRLSEKLSGVVKADEAYAKDRAIEKKNAITRALIEFSGALGVATEVSMREE